MLHLRNSDPLLRGKPNRRRPCHPLPMVLPGNSSPPPTVVPILCRQPTVPEATFNSELPTTRFPIVAICRRPQAPQIQRFPVPKCGKCSRQETSIAITTISRRRVLHYPQ